MTKIKDLLFAAFWAGLAGLISAGIFEEIAKAERKTGGIQLAKDLLGYQIAPYLIAAVVFVFYLKIVNDED